MERFLLIFFALVSFLPGLIFRRFYYSGPFSKQYKYNASLIFIFFFSFIPSILIHCLSFWIISWLADENFSGILIKIEDHYSKIKKDTTTNNDITRYYLTFLKYNVGIWILSASLGRLSNIFVRKWFKLDLKFKLLRFKNSWHYFFSREFLKFKSVQKAISIKNNRWCDIFIKSDEKGTTLHHKGKLLDYIIENNKLEYIVLLKTNYNNEESTIVIPYSNIKYIETRVVDAEGPT